MMDFFQGHEPAIRVGAFGIVLAAMMMWEWRAPRRPLLAPRTARWIANLGMVALNTALIRLTFPIAAVGVAALAGEHGFGLFNWFAVPRAPAIALSVIALDLAVYTQHVVFHNVPLLWRLHRMHHTDVDIDTTTGIRFHPLEIMMSMAFKMVVVAALGAPVSAVIVFEVLLNATAMFNHGNVRLPAALDRLLRIAIVTPDFHRVHHSIHRDETDSNYGFNLSIWDRLFGTYVPQPRDGHDGMTIGLDVFRTPSDRRLHRLLIQPFLKA